jgi:hypothetical protein
LVWKIPPTFQNRNTNFFPSGFKLLGAVVMTPPVDVKAASPGTSVPFGNCLYATLTSADTDAAPAHKRAASTTAANGAERRIVISPPPHAVFLVGAYQPHFQTHEVDQCCRMIEPGE